MLNPGLGLGLVFLGGGYVMFLKTKMSESPLKLESTLSYTQNICLNFTIHLKKGGQNSDNIIRTKI